MRYSTYISHKGLHVVVTNHQLHYVMLKVACAVPFVRLIKSTSVIDRPCPLHSVLFVEDGLEPMHY